MGYRKLWIILPFVCNFVKKIDASYTFFCLIFKIKNMSPNFYNDVNAIIDAASSTKFSLTPEFVVFFIGQVIDAVTHEIRFMGKTPAHSPKAARAKVYKIFFDKHGDFSDDLEFFSDRDFLMQVFDEVSSILTVPDLRAKDAIIVDRLQHDEKFASDFLFCSPDQPDNIAFGEDRLGNA